MGLAEPPRLVDRTPRLDVMPCVAGIETGKADRPRRTWWSGGSGVTGARVAAGTIRTTAELDLAVGALIGLPGGKRRRFVSVAVDRVLAAGRAAPVDVTPEILSRPLGHVVELALGRKACLEASFGAEPAGHAPIRTQVMAFLAAHAPGGRWFALTEDQWSDVRLLHGFGVDGLPLASRSRLGGSLAGLVQEGFVVHRVRAVDRGFVTETLSRSDGSVSASARMPARCAGEAGDLAGTLGVPFVGLSPPSAAEYEDVAAARLEAFAARAGWDADRAQARRRSRPPPPSPPMDRGRLDRIRTLAAGYGATDAFRRDLGTLFPREPAPVLPRDTGNAGYPELELIPQPGAHWTERRIEDGLSPAFGFVVALAQNAGTGVEEWMARRTAVRPS